MRTRKLSTQLVLGQAGEEHGGRLRRGKGPLQEVDFGALTGTRERKDELRMGTCGGSDGFEGWSENRGAEG